MKVMKLALLGTAALAAASVSARAENLDALKAQIEALNARVATLEATPAVPAGFMAVSMSEGQIMVPGGALRGYNGAKQHIISVMPTADAPAAASTSVAWSGYVKAAVVMSHSGQPAPTTDYVDIVAKAGLNVTGKTDTAVGEVGVSISLLAATAGSGASNWGTTGFGDDGFKGWWKLTPNISLIGGKFGSLSGNGKGWNDGCTCHYGLGDANGGYGLGDAAQLQLAYADGPLGFAVAVEDSTNLTPNVNTFGFAGEMTYAGDMFSAELSAGTRAFAAAGSTNNWTVNGGIGTKFDVVSLSLAAGIGHENGNGGAGNDYTKASAIASVALGDSAHFEAGVSSKWTNGLNNIAAGAGIYYDPVKQLTIGLEAGWTQNNITGAGVAGTGVASTSADLVTIFRF